MSLCIDLQYTWNFLYHNFNEGGHLLWLRVISIDIVVGLLIVIVSRILVIIIIGGPTSILCTLVVYFLLYAYHKVYLFISFVAEIF